jgi:PAS domain S-box-containing protein
MKPVSRKFRWVAALFVSVLWLCPNPLAAADSLITVGIYENPPKVYFDDNGEPAGIFVELLEEVARLESWVLNYVSCTWNNCLTALENGEIDLMPDVAFTYQRTQRFGFNTVPVIESWSQVYANPNMNITTLSDLEGKNISLVEGSVQQPLFHQIMNGFGYVFREVHASSFPDAFTEVKIGVADAAVVNYYFGEAHYKNYGLKKTPVIFNPAVLHFATNTGKNGWILETIDNYLTDWKKTPQSVYYKTLANHIQPERSTEILHTHRTFIYALAATFAAAVLIFLFLQKRINRKTRELIRINKKLNYEEQKFRGYIEHAPFGVFVTNERGIYVDVNPEACRLTGYSRQELIGKAVPDILSEEGKKPALNHFNAVIKTGKASVVVPYVTKSSEKRLWNVTAAQISPKRFIGFVEDVTEEQKIRNRMQIMRMVFDQSVNEIYLFDTENLQFRYVNEAAAKNTGYATWELEKMTPLDLKQNLSASRFDELIQPLLNKEKKVVDFETQHYRKDRTFYEAEVFMQLIENENEELFSAVVLDITDRKSKEKELQQIKDSLVKEVDEKTRELNRQIAELESFREATIERELRMEELRKEIEQLKIEKK